jgi:hypothetical protein
MVDQRKKVHTMLKHMYPIHLHMSTTKNVATENTIMSEHEHTSNTMRGSSAEAWD